MGLAAACARVEPGRYGVASLDIRGNAELAEAPLEACLITRERPPFGITLGVSDASCGAPPFDSQSPKLRLWRWPSTDWPAFNQQIFEQDLERVVRFYRARGYYEARVVRTRLDPPEATQPGAVGRCGSRERNCKVSVLIWVDEGEPTRVGSIELRGLDTVGRETQRKVREAVVLEPGDLADERRYDEGKAGIREQLRRAGYAGTRVTGSVHVDTEQHRAEVVYEVEPGAIYTFGHVSVEGHEGKGERVTIAAAALRAGRRYDPRRVRSAQAAVFGLGAFSTVELHEHLDPTSNTVAVSIEVTPLPRNALRASVGVTSGAVQRTATSESVSIPQWDTHIAGRYERRRIFGGLGQLSLEERPRVIFSRDFPRLTTPSYGNIVKLTLQQPGLIEARTQTFFESVWDYGPEPFLGFVRSDVFFELGTRRRFFKQKLTVTLALEQDVFLVDPSPDNVSSDGEPQTSYVYDLFEQDVRLDMRNNRTRPSHGIYLSLNTTQAVRWDGSDWTAFRVAPELRGYVPLFWDLVWATRFGLAALFIESASADLDPTSQRLGPMTYRLRGGGANSNRGFLAGTLGAGLTGGVRRWEASTELRVALGRAFVLAGFFDLGDVNDSVVFRFSHLNAAAGYGFRYYTVLGVVRLDFGYRIAALQRADGSSAIAADADRLPISRVPGAIHLTIGDAF